MTKTRQLGVAAELPRSSLNWIHIAEVEFDRRKLDLDKYRVSVVEEDDSVIVILTGLKEPKNSVGSETDQILTGLKEPKNSVGSETDQIGVRPAILRFSTQPKRVP